MILHAFHFSQTLYLSPTFGVTKVTHSIFVGLLWRIQINRGESGASFSQLTRKSSLYSAVCFTKSESARHASPQRSHLPSGGWRRKSKMRCLDYIVCSKPLMKFVFALLYIFCLILVKYVILGVTVEMFHDMILYSKFYCCLATTLKLWHPDLASTGPSLCKARSYSLLPGGYIEYEAMPSFNSDTKSVTWSGFSLRSQWMSRCIESVMIVLL